VLTLLLVAAIFGIVNAFVAPVVKFLTLPFILLTLGLLLVVINAVMLLLVARFVDELDLAFRGNGFGTAVGGALVISLVAWALGHAVRED